MYVASTHCCIFPELTLCLGVSNGGLILGALAVYNEDPTGKAAKLLPQAVAGALQYCARATSTDGSWLETPDYWYFGIQTSAQIASALISATGSDHTMLSVNPDLTKTGLFRMYSKGMTEKFNWGDCGPPKITATANALLFYGRELKSKLLNHSYSNGHFWSLTSIDFAVPRWTLFQRDEADVADPLSILWYDSSTTGKWSEGLELDHYFPDPRTSWASMRSSWTDHNGLFVAMKGGAEMGHQTRKLTSPYCEHL